MRSRNQKRNLGKKVKKSKSGKSRKNVKRGGVNTRTSFDRNVDQAVQDSSFEQLAKLLKDINKRLQKVENEGISIGNLVLSIEKKLQDKGILE